MSASRAASEASRAAALQDGRVRAVAAAPIELGERTRVALAEVEGQRDDALSWLSTTRALLDVLARGGGVRPTAPAVAHALVANLGVESAAVVLREKGGTLWTAGHAAQADLVGGPPGPAHEAAWLTLAGLIAPDRDPVWFRRTPDGGFEATSIGGVEGEGFIVLPLVLGDEVGGALLLHTLVTPPTLFGRPAGLALLAQVVGTILAVARGRDATGWLCDRLSEELGAARRTVDSQAAGLRAREERIAALTRVIAKLGDVAI